MGKGNNSTEKRWSSLLAKWCMAVLLILTVTGLSVTFGPFHATVEWGLLVHTVVGVAALLPLLWYSWVHWLDYKRYALSHVVLLGYVGLAGLLVCLVSGIVVTWQGLFDVRMSPVWRNVHLISTFVALIGILPHLVFAVVRVLAAEAAPHARRYLWTTLGITAVGLLVTVVLAQVYAGARYVNEFPEDYSFLYGEDRPFAPSLARTSTGGAFDERSFAGSETCGTSGCHTQILQEWKPSAHRYSAMDTIFQAIQGVMAKQNGPESTRYCGGCHDPISLFSGTKNIFVEADKLTSLAGYNEGVSCLACHAIRETDLAGNANYVIDQPAEYLWQWSDEGVTRVVRDFLIRTYPDEHNKLSKRMFKAPEYCAACHKQFIDEEVNQVGWVQLQNQYDNWKASHWFHEGDPTKTIECRECHMPLVDSTDPSAGDAADYNRSPGDGKHRSHRFIASNQLMPKMLELEGWQEQLDLTDQWLQGTFEIPEIRDKWAEGPIVKLALDVPSQVPAGQEIPIRAIFTSNKVGHDYPTGPLDIIQSWLEIVVVDDQGNIVFASGRKDETHFIEPGSFLFKAEPIDQEGNLIDRHNLWEMVGVRFRRALFPGYSDTVEYKVDCPGSLLGPPQGEPSADTGDEGVQEVEVPAVDAVGRLHITATLKYRKVDQFLINFLFGEDSGITAPVVDIDRATATVEIVQSTAARTAPPKG
ncbi:MAG: multiheme c-type cytochrome [Planctomycetota bacterium]